MSSSLGQVIRWVQSSWPTWFAEEAVNLRPIVLAGRNPHQRRALVFVFAAREPAPRAFLKVGLDPADRPHIEREVNSVQALSVLGLGKSVVPLPQAYGLYVEGAVTVGGFSALEGRRLLVPPLMGRAPILGKRSMARFWRETSRLGLEIGRFSPSGDRVDGHWLGERVDRFRHLYASATTTKAVLRAFQRTVESTRFSSQLTWQHGDMAVGNVLLRREGLCLVDWEASSPDYEPWFDLTTAPAAAVILGARQTGEDVETVAQCVLSDERWTGRLMREAMTDAWSCELPLGWGVVLSTMRRALRRLEGGGDRALPYARVALAMIMDPQLRAHARWITPT